MSYPFGPDTHMYRPDLDAWLTAVAVRYGAEFRERAPVQQVVLRDDGVEIQAGSRTYRARFLADASGFRSVLAEKEGLRDETRVATDSRTLFTHMVGVRTIRETRRESHRAVPSPPDQGTLHHIFDGGWFWVIPFNNHSASVNPVCSVGLTLDRRRHPDNSADPEAEFFSFVARFPTVARQFQGARAIRSWVKTGRLQYQSSRLTGARWCLLPHAANFIDALFSGGMTQTLIGINGVARLLLDAVKHDRFDPALVAAIEEGAREDRAILDRVVHGAFVAFRSHAFFNAWFRIWAIGNFHASAGLSRLHMKYLSTGDRAYLGKVNEAPYRRVLGMDNPRVRALLEDGYRLIEAFGRSEIDEAKAVDGLYALLRKQDWVPPHFHVGDPGRSELASFTVFPLVSLMLWGKRHAPADMRGFYYDSGPVFFWELTKSLGREGWRGLSSFARVVIDAHYSSGRS
jgi:FADH2 O2-dependent halogenase